MSGSARLTQKWEKCYLEDRQFCTSCRYKILSIPKAVRLGPEASPASGNTAAASSHSDSVFERSDELATGKLGKESLRDDKKDADDPLAGLPFWLEDFTDNLIPTEVPAPAHISQDSDSEYSAKVGTMSRKQSIFTHFPKDRNCDVCSRTKMTKASCRRRNGEAPPRAEKFGDSTSANHKVLDEGCESRDNHRYAVVVQDLATRLIQSCPCTRNLHLRRKKSLLKFLELSQALKLYIRTTRWNLGKHVRFCHGITALQHLIDPRRMASLKEPSDE